MVTSGKTELAKLLSAFPQLSVANSPGKEESTEERYRKVKQKYVLQEHRKIRIRNALLRILSNFYVKNLCKVKMQCCKSVRQDYVNNKGTCL